MEPIEEPTPDGDSWWAQAGTLPRIAIFLVIIAAAWFMLKELASLLRPLLTASLLCYMILPIHKWLHRGRSLTATVFIMAGSGSIILVVVGLLAYGSVVEFNDELPQLTKRAYEIADKFSKWSNENLPDWLSESLDQAARVESKGAQNLPDFSKLVVQHAANIFFEVLIVGLYVFFLLFEAKRLTRRFESGLHGGSVTPFRLTVETINQGISSYVRAKVLSSLILAVPITIVLAFFGVKSAAIWGLLTFFCNFIPYVGSIVAGGSPMILSFLYLPFGWQPFAAAGFVVFWHTASASFIEPMLLGNAVGLSPLVILISLTFWGLCWGLVGMFLAIPLTVAIKIVLSNIDATKAIAASLGDD